MPDRSPAYAAALAASLHWDSARDEPYLQPPSFPDLRLVPYRPGIAGDLVTLFNHPPVGERLFVLPYPMSSAFAEQMLSDTLAKQAPILATLRARRAERTLRDSGEGQDEKVQVHAPVWPFKALWSEAEGRVVGDVFLWPNAEPLQVAGCEGVTGSGGAGRPGEEGEAGEGSEATNDETTDQHPQWTVGYVLEPALYGRGVMSEVLGCVLEGWVRPEMGVRVAASIAVDNAASAAVAVRNGFVYSREEGTEWPKEKGGGVRYHGLYTWPS
ncbi:hypothetical protein CspeluHIS016_0307110 [Cutaneotrichosporon spelunceum]|uniref:N-acetyltransferase domain-containing protein n=1 Tax=Cutaneotrichosporon spelunceum TaxID=1672016 RepID=A0AAD3YBD0_9TREE|nr:hypothetical protein CspeluHIS016_0307110 [Cutaneotrichosporon spelunceum]